MAAAFAGWLLTVGAGMGMLWAYAGSPGPSETASAVWPSGATITPDPARPTLVIFLHPQCPCSRATLAELARLVAAAPGRASIHAFFFRPSGAPKGWEHTDLWTTASAIPGVQVKRDDDGAQARAFGTQVSGQALLYAPAGTLLFSGGITAARGHEGDSDGRAALTALLRGQPSSRATAPAFGCLLRGEAPDMRSGGSPAPAARSVIDEVAP